MKTFIYLYICVNVKHASEFKSKGKSWEREIIESQLYHTQRHMLGETHSLT